MNFGETLEVDRGVAAEEIQSCRGEQDPGRPADRSQQQVFCQRAPDKPPLGSAEGRAQGSVAAAGKARVRAECW
jgi:hypothetical protein